jgi:hypothetical protein
MNTLLDKFNKVTVKASSLLPEEDKKVLDVLHFQYETAMERLEEWRGFFEMELRKCETTSYNIKEYGSGELHIEKSYKPDNGEPFSLCVFYPGYDILAINKLMIKCRQVYLHACYDHFTGKYSVSITQHIEDLNKQKKLTYQHVVDDIRVSLGGLNFNAIAKEQIISRFRGNLNKWGKSILTLANKNVQLENYTHYGSGAEKQLQPLQDIIMLFETGEPREARLFNMQEFTAYFEDSRTYKTDEDYVFEFMQNVAGIRFYKNGKVIIKFNSPALAKSFCELIDYHTL